MIILYILAILVSLLPLVPESIVPFVIKWPIVMVVLISLTALFNLKKRDSLYLTCDAKKVVLKRGLFHPLTTYAAASSFFGGFMLMETALLKANLNDVIFDLGKFFSLNNKDYTLIMIIGMVFVAFGIILEFSKWVLSRHASNSNLRGRSFYYIALTLFTCFVYGLLAWKGLYLHVDENLLDYLLNGYNIYVFYGVVGFFVIFDLLMTIFRGAHYHKLKVRANLSDEELAAEKANLKALKLEAKENKEFKAYNMRQKAMLKDELKRQEKEALKQEKLAKKQGKKANEEPVEAPVQEEQPVETTVQEPVVEEAPAQEPVVEEATAQEPVVEEQPVEEAPVVEEEQPVEEAPVEEVKLSKKELKRQAKDAKSARKLTDKLAKKQAKLAKKVAKKNKKNK